jgi:hypothetical protein
MFRNGLRLYIQVWYGMVWCGMVWYGIVCFACISINSLVGRRVSSISMHVKHTVPQLCVNRLPEDEPSGSKHVEDIIK